MIVGSSAVWSDESTISKPVGTKAQGVANTGTAKTNQFWWPDQLNLSSLRDHDSRSNPLGADFNYADAFATLDLDQAKADIDKVLTESQDWWPADFGNYGPFFIRMSWHSAGTYRTLDGRGGGDGGQMRFNPLNSWPDNGNLDKAKRLLWPVKKKYGAALSWGDLMILAGNVALENMGFETFGFAGGRADDWEPDLVYWGPEVEMLASDRRDEDGKLKRPLGAAHMGLIYVNPEGPLGKPDPVGSARSIRESFGRMAMNDEETVALIAGGHTFGKMHGAHSASKCVGAEPGAAAIEEQGLGWTNKCGKGHSEDTVTSGLEGAWTQAPTRWTTLYLSNLLNNDWVQVRSAAGAIQWIPKNEALHESVPDAHVEGKKNPPVMTTADLALKFDPQYKKISERFLANPDEYRLAFAKAWFKLTHRDMGPRSHYLGNEVPDEVLVWQDPIPASTTSKLTEKDISTLKKKIIDSGLSTQSLVRVAWASASTYRASDKRGGANGARLALSPQREWAINNPKEVNQVVSALHKIKKGMKGKSISLADLIVLAGNTGVEQAAKQGGVDVEVPTTLGRGDATQDQTDVASFNFLNPSADAFRNYFADNEAYKSPTEMMIDKADQLNLTVPELTALIGGMRAIGANADDSDVGVLTDRKGVLTNDFFVNLLDMSTVWKKSQQQGLYDGYDRVSGERKYSASSVDLIFGSNSELRAVAEAYAYDGSNERFVRDFATTWNKVMTLDLN
ncbi:MAG: catalase/peroxidase HPI [Gammaproteobacteria bacterium]|nr:catalase/peroxidase HPI [Gammaproteobacteria bacterium]